MKLGNTVIFGDSYSTFLGYIPEGYAVYYTPTYFTAHMNRAIAYSRLGHIAQALKDFDIAEQLRKEEPMLYFNRGVAYYNIKQYEKAVEDFSHAIMYAPQNPRFFLERARALDKAGYPANAYADLEEAIAALSNIIGNDEIA